MVPRRSDDRVTLIHCMVVLLPACSLAICCVVVFGLRVSLAVMVDVQYKQV